MPTVKLAFFVYVSLSVTSLWHIFSLTIYKLLLTVLIFYLQTKT